MANNFNISDKAVTLPDDPGIFVEGQWGYATVGNEGKITSAGVYDKMESKDKGSVLIVDSSGARLVSDTDNGIDDEAFTRTKGAVHQLNQNILWTWKIVLDSNADVRWFLGLREAGIISPLITDNILGPGVGLLFSTSRPDTNFQFVAHDGAVQTLVDTGIAVDTAIHYLTIDADAPGTTTIVTMKDAAFAVEATATFTTEGPGPTVELHSQEWIRTLAAAVKVQSFYYGTCVARGT